VISASVKFIRSSDKGVPPAPSDWATLVAWIKGVFINGFNEVNVTRVAHQTGELTLTLPDNHGFGQWQVLSLSGAADARFNVDMRVLRVRGQEVVCSVDNKLPPTTTGAMKVKQAPVGWEITYENETVLVLHSKAPGGQYYFQFLKRGDQRIEIRGCEGWANGQPVNEWYSSESSTESKSWWGGLESVPRFWAVVGDDQLFLTITGVSGVALHPRDAGFSGSSTLGIFGKFESFNPAIPGHTLLSYAPYGYASSWHSGAEFNSRLGDGRNTDPGMNVSRTKLGQFRPTGVWCNVWGADANAEQSDYPVGVQGGVVLSPTYVSSTAALWGRVPGVYRGSDYPTNQVLTGVPGLDGHAFIAVGGGGLGRDRWFIDITGPWR
jgi:hypothetical protein